MAIVGAKDDVLSGVLAARWNTASKKFMALAEAIPEEKFDTELVRDGRTCDEVLRHVAYWNRYVADTLNGRTADDSANEVKRQELPERVQILADIKTNTSEIARGIRQNLNEKMLEAFSMGLEHVCEHYGQLAVYARLMGIVPPASRS